MGLLGRLVLYILVFVALVWVLLGIDPIETGSRFWNHMGGLWGRVSSIGTEVTDTADDMKAAAESQLQQATDRLNGVDPYEQINQKLTAEM